MSCLVEQEFDVVEGGGIIVQKLVVHKAFILAGVKAYKLAIRREAHQVAACFAGGCGIQRANLPLAAKLVHIPALLQHEGENGCPVRFQGADVHIAVAAQGAAVKQIQGIAAAYSPGEGRRAKKISCLCQ